MVDAYDRMRAQCDSRLVLNSMNDGARRSMHGILGARDWACVRLVLVSHQMKTANHRTVSFPADKY